MTEIKFKTIVKISEKIKSAVEHDHKLPGSVTVDKVEYTYTTAAYLIANGVVNPGKDVELLKMSKAPAPSGETVDLKLTTNEYKSLAKNLLTFMKPKAHRRLPNFLTCKGKKIKQRVFIYSFAKIIVFYAENNRLPTSCKFKTSETVAKSTNTSTSSKSKTSNSTKKSNCINPYTSKPHYTEQGNGKLGQITNHHCGPNMVHQMLKKFGVTKYSQKDIGKLAGTTSSGTDPSSLKSAIEYIARKTGLNLKVQRKYLSDFGKTTSAQFEALAKLMCKPNVFVGCHLGYQDSGSAGGSGYKIFGHYETFDKIDVKNKKIRVLNSLGGHCGSGYCGHLQWRSYSLQKTYINNKTGVPSIWIITKQ